MEKIEIKSSSVVHASMPSQCVTFMFDLTDEDAREDFATFTKAKGMSLALWNIGSDIRGWCKYGFDGTKEELLDAIHKSYYESLTDHHVESEGY